ncbi:MAG: sialidase family protein, partial [Candidatus Hydrogenedentes bacterium]|nr:sialidase family protein [Candidatus Hydrogenedentota bacterium]
MKPLAFVVCVVCVFSGFYAYAVEDPAPLFDMGDLYTDQRIPKIVVATDGSVLAFAKSCHLLRRSEDGGATWSEAVEVGPNAGGNAIVDEVNGNVLILNGKPACVWLSTDHGKAWRREDITILPNPYGHGAPDGTVAINTHCSESGVTLRYGEHKGRLLLPCRVMPPEGNN